MNSITLKVDHQYLYDQLIERLRDHNAVMLQIFDPDVEEPLFQTNTFTIEPRMLSRQHVFVSTAEDVCNEIENRIDSNLTWVENDQNRTSSDDEEYSYSEYDQNLEDEVFADEEQLQPEFSDHILSNAQNFEEDTMTQQENTNSSLIITHPQQMNSQIDENANADILTPNLPQKAHSAPPSPPRNTQTQIELTMPHSEFVKLSDQLVNDFNQLGCLYKSISMPKNDLQAIQTANRVPNYYERVHSSIKNVCSFLDRFIPLFGGILQILYSMLGMIKQFKIKQQKYICNEQELKKHVTICLLTGVGFDSYARIMAYNNIIIPSKSALYEFQKKVAIDIENLTLDDIERQKNDAKIKETVLAFDCSWGGRRLSEKAIAVMTDVYNNFVGLFRICLKGFKDANKFKTVVPIDDDLSSTMMESELLKSLIQSDDLQQLKSFVSDGDTKASHILSDADLQTMQFRDVNHTIISKFKSLKVAHDDLLKLFRSILNNDELSIEQKIVKWRNTKSLFENHESKDEIYDFIESTYQLFHFVRPGIHTNFCESFNAVKARFARKESSWKIGFIIRSFIAVLAYNNPNWKEILRKFMKLDISQYDPVNIRRICGIEARSMKDRARVKSAKYKKQVLSKIENKELKKKAKENHLAYKSNSEPTNHTIIKKREILGNFTKNEGCPVDWKNKTWYFRKTSDCSLEEMRHRLYDLDYIYARFNSDVALCIFPNRYAVESMLATIPPDKILKHILADEILEDIMTNCAVGQGTVDIRANGKDQTSSIRRFITHSSLKCGLQNLRDFCYCNVVVQLLTFIPTLKNEMSKFLFNIISKYEAFQSMRAANESLRPICDAEEKAIMLCTQLYNAINRDFTKTISMSTFLEIFYSGYDDEKPNDPVLFIEILLNTISQVDPLIIDCEPTEFFTSTFSANEKQFYLNWMNHEFDAVPDNWPTYLFVKAFNCKTYILPRHFADNKEITYHPVAYILNPINHFTAVIEYKDSAYHYLDDSKYELLPYKLMKQLVGEHLDRAFIIVYEKRKRI